MCTQFTALKVFIVSYWSGGDNNGVLTFMVIIFLYVRGGVSSGNTW